MSFIRLTILVVYVMWPAAAYAADGSVHLYLQPLSPEAASLTFRVTSLSAVGANDAQHALKLNLRVVSHADARRQRLLASGRLPLGSYAGFTMTVKQAAVKSGRAETALAVPDRPVRIDFPFTVAEQNSPLVWLTLRYNESVGDGLEFIPAFSVVAPPRPIAGHAGFVTNSNANTITVLDKNLAQAVAVVDTCAGPSGMALDQPRRRLSVACSKDDEIQALDVQTGDIVERSRVSPGDRPRELALTPDGVTLISVNSGSNSISFFDAGSLTRQERVNVGSSPGSILIDASGRRGFVFNTLSSSLSVIDIANRSVAATMSTESAPLRGRLNRRGDRLFVIHERSPYMTVLDPQQLTILNRVRLRVAASAIAVDSIRDLVCLSGSTDTTVDFYDPNALMPLYVLRTTTDVSYLAIDAEDNNLYMVSPGTRSVVVARLTNRTVAAEIDVDDAPYWVAVMGEKK